MLCPPVLLAAMLFTDIPASAAEPTITAIAFSPDGKSVVIGSQSGLQVRSWPDLKQRRPIETGLVHLHDFIAGDSLPRLW